ncbi:MAG: amidohydrolase [Tenericutes bacterium]|nr:amidohydrolase [Mycoplasmatota bacterium]
MEDFKDLEKYIIKNRRHFHEFPELGFECVKTHDYIRDELRRLKINSFPHIGKNSIVAVVENGKGPIIGLRADFDALALEEDTDLSFKSKNIGKMHACGHDCHASMLLGAVKYLSEHLDEWRGTVKFIFQEAEEGPNPGGALGIIANGMLDDVDEFFALHVTSDNFAGQLAYNDRETLASADTIKIRFIGKGGHAAYPHLSIDPIIMQAEFITAVQSIVSRKLDPMETGVITIAQVKAGTTHNIIPNEAYVEGTVRTFKQETRVLFEKELHRLTEHIAKANGGDYEFNYIREYDPTINTVEESALLASEAVKLLGKENVIKLDKPSMGAEDFSRYIIHKKGAMAWLGVGFKDKYNYSVHHPKFEVNESALINGTRLFINIVKRIGEK